MFPFLNTMEIIQAFYEDKDEQKFLESCRSLNIECKVTETTEIKTVYKIGGQKPIAFVVYYPAIAEVSVVWFTCNFAT